AISELENTLKTPTPELNTAQVLWEREEAPKQAKWSLLDPEKFTSANAAGFTKLEDKSLRVRPSVEKDTYTIVAHTNLQEIVGFQLEALPDDTPRKTVEQPKENRFTLTSIRVQSTSQNDEKEDRMVSLRNARADFSPQGFPVTNAIDANA